MPAEPPVPHARDGQIRSRDKPPDHADISELVEQLVNAHGHPETPVCVHKVKPPADFFLAQIDVVVNQKFGD